MHQKIVCNVVQALPELIIVSYETSNHKIFQGALINVETKFPLDQIEDQLNDDNPRDYMSENFHTVSKRHTYFQQQKDGEKVLAANTQATSSRRLGVRLRARQVLCNNCKNVCTESGETVQPKRKQQLSNIDSRKSSTSPEVTTKPKGRHGRLSKCPSPSTSSTDVVRIGLVPKLKRLNPIEIEKFSPPQQIDSANYNEEIEERNKPKLSHQEPLKIRFANFSKLASSSSSTKSASTSTHSTVEKISVNVDNDTSQEIVDLCTMKSRHDDSDRRPVMTPSMVNKSKVLESENASGKGRTQRRKRTAAGTIQDAWREVESDESYNYNSFVEPAPPPPLPLSTPVLKISFGKLGQGTVMKIPSKINNPITSESFENDENAESPNVEKSPSSFWANRSPRYISRESSAAAKAAKKALKRARKEASRRSGHGGVSPGYPIRSSPSANAAHSADFVGCYSPAASTSDVGDPFTVVSRPQPVYEESDESSPAYPFSPFCESGLPVAVAGPEVTPPEVDASPVKPKKHKRKKHKKKKAGGLEDPEVCQASVESDVNVSSHMDHSSADPLSLMGTSSEAEPPMEAIRPGSVIWGKTLSDIWWPAKVIRILQLQPFEVEANWYNNTTRMADEVELAVLPHDHIRPFLDFFQEFRQMPSSNATFESAVNMASADLESSQSTSCLDSSAGPPEPPSFSPETSPRTVNCLS